jgi:hypothetical protein
VIGVIAWKFFTVQRQAATATTGTGWRLGPWPVNPNEVTTRQDLIRAFEHLSLLLLGPAARVWNHRQIATRLGAREDEAAAERRRAASHLAVLYEQARYAPPSDPLPEGELAGARRDLCLLAGVAPA